MALAGLLFDKDGTLIHFNATWNPAILSVLQQQAKGNAAVLRRLAAALDYDLETSAFHPKDAFVAGAWGDFGSDWAAALGQTNDQAFENATNTLLIEACLRTLAPVGAPVDIARRLTARGVLLGIATNDAELAARHQAEALGLTPHLSFVAGYDSGFKPKPAPDMVQGFARTIGTEPARIAMVGDSLHDMEAARRAGAVAIGVLTGPLKRHEFAGHADHIIDSIADLPDLMDRIQASTSTSSGLK